MPVVRHVKRLSVAQKRPLRAEEIQAAIDAAAADKRETPRPAPSFTQAVPAAPTKKEPAPSGEEKE